MRDEGRCSRKVFKSFCKGREIVDNFRRIVVSNRKLLALRVLYEEGGSGVKRTWGIRRLVRLAMRKKRISQSG
jgi:hypothetical protein